MAKKKSDVDQLVGILEEFEEEDVCRAIERMELCREKRLDPFCVLDKGAPIFRAIFTGVEYPIKDRKDLISKAGGQERLVAIPDPSGGQRVYALGDILDAFPQLDKLFPIETATGLVRKFAALERQRRKEGKPSPLLKIGGEHMAKITRERSWEEVKRLTREKLEIPFIGRPKEATTGLELLKAFKNNEGLKILKGGPDNVSLILGDWLKWLVEFIENYNRDAALAAAASAQQQANAAETAANTAEDRVQDVAGASTNTQAQQAVSEVCASATEAGTAAQQAANFAATACAHAGSVPDNIEAQTACSNAQAAAAQANSAANRAQDACDTAQDIASISIVTICGHVNEEDPCCDDDVDGASITVCNIDYPEIPCQTTTTDGSGNYCVTGRFGHSSRVGCANVRVTMNSGSGWGNISRTRQITVCSSSPANVDFSFDVPGAE